MTSVCPSRTRSSRATSHPSIDFSLPKPDPILPLYEPPKFDFSLPKPDPIVPRYEPPKYDFSLPKPDPIVPLYEPPKYNFEPPKYEPPPLPPPSPVYDIGHNLIGWKPELDNHILTGIGGNGPRLTVDPGGFVRDPLDNLIGQMGPLNTLYPPPSLPDMPDYGPPQSGPEQWDPGYSPMSPLA